MSKARENFFKKLFSIYFIVYEKIHFYHSLLSFEWPDAIPLDNSIGFISGLFAIIGGGIGLGFCCEKENRTSQSCAIQAFLAFAIIGIVASLAAVITNINSAMSMSYFISGQGNGILEFG